MSTPTRPARRRRGIRDPRVVLGLGVTALALWFALRDVDFVEVGQVLASADLPLLLGLSVPAYLVSVYIRALRWRHLTNPIQPIPLSALFRATAVGFMANNLFPFRIGEVVRAWTLARDVGAPTAAIFGTIILERVVDAIVVVGMAFVLIAVRGSGLGIAGFSLQALPLLLIAGLPIGFIVALRVAPDSLIRFTMGVLGVVLPERFEAEVEGQLRRLADGLEALRGGSHLAWIALHSVLIWLVLSPIPFYAALVALDLEMETPLQTLGAAYVVLIFVGAAVALPSAPGFLGTYHVAARFALSGFGVAAAPALALGTLAHVTFWVTLTALGLVVLRSHGTSLESTLEAGRDSGANPETR